VNSQPSITRSTGQTVAPACLLFFSLLLTACCVRPAVAAAIPNPFPADSVSITTLPNGLRLVVKEDHSLPIVAANVVIRGGSGVEGASRAAAHYTEHCVFQGTEHYPDTLAPQRAIEQAGGISNGITTRDSTRLEASIASDKVDLVVNILAEIALHPTLTDTIFTGQRPILLAEVQQDEDTPLVTAMNKAYQLGYTTHAYRNPPSGTINDLLRITPDEVRTYHDTWYVPNNMSVVLVGDVTVARAVKLVTDAFGAAPAGKLPDRPAPEIGLPGNPAITHLLRQVPDTYEAITYAAPSASNFPSMAAMDVLVTLLADGLDAQLPGWWGKDGVKVSDFGGEYVSTHDPGRLVIWAETSPAATGVLRRSTDNLLQSIARGTALPPDALELAKTRVAASFLLQNETYSGQSGTLAFYEALYGAQWVTQYVPTIQDVSLDRLRLVTPLEPLAIVTVGTPPV
jgi:zinc protease